MVQLVFEPEQSQHFTPALRILTSRDGGVQSRTVGKLAELYREEQQSGAFKPRTDVGTLAYAVVRVTEGFIYSDAIIGGAARYLVPGGTLALEVAAVWRQAQEVARLVDATGMFTTARIVRDYAGAERVVIAKSVGGDGSHRG